MLTLLVNETDYLQRCAGNQGILHNFGNDVKMPYEALQELHFG
jgi:hypothetical protein